MSPRDNRASFAGLLNRARLERHLSIRTLARIADVPAATAQGWLSGKHFPTPALRGRYLRLVAQLGLADQVPDDLWDSTWAVMQPALRDKAAPYLGLRPYGVADEARFFGRDAESRRLADRIADVAAADGHGLVFLVGPSGSGKSSLLAAGLVARECTNGALAGWSVETVAAGGLPDLAALPRLVVVDQFEDALVMDADARQRIVSSLAVLAERTMVVAGLRSDAFAEAAQDQRLVPALSRPVLLAPMSRDEARQVVVGPAELAGVSVDDDLIRVLLAEMAPGAADGAVAPGMLPLLSNALLATWAAGSGERMTLADYDTAGGMSQAVESLAEQVFVSLDPVQQVAAERLFLRLVRVSSDLVVREPLPLAQVDSGTRAVMDAFVSARMLTVGDTEVRISHDSLLRHWHRLENWVSVRRGDLLVLERIRRAAAVWEETGRDPEALIPVRRLAAATQWIDEAGWRRLLTGVEREFLDASQAHFTSVLDHERRVNARLLRQRRVAVALTAVATVLALVAGVGFWRARDFQLTAESARQDARAAQLEAQSRQVATMARTLRERDPNLAAQFAGIARDLAGTTEANSMLLDATAVDSPVRWLGSGSSVLAVSPDGQVVARADGVGQVTLWRADDLVRHPGRAFTADPAGGSLFGLAFAEQPGRLLLAVGGIGSRSVWDVTGEPELVADLGKAGHTTYSVAFSPDGGLLALGDEAGSVEFVDISGASPRPAGSVALDVLPDGTTPAVKAVALDATTAYVAGAPGRVARWKISAGAPVRAPDLTYTFKGLTPVAQTLAVSPQGRVLAGLAGSGVVRWGVQEDRVTAQEPVTGFNSWINDVSFSADGTRFIVASSDQSAGVFDAASGVELRRLTGPAIVTGADFAGSRLVTADTEGVLRVWPAHGPALRLGGQPIYNLATDASGSWLAGGTPSSGIQLWRLGEQRRQLPPPAAPTLPAGDYQVGAVGVAPDGGFLVGGSALGSVLSWPLSGTGAGEGSAVRVSGEYIAQTAVAPNGRLVAAPEFQGEYTYLLRADGAGRLAEAARIETPVPQLVWFSPDSRLLAAALAGNRVEVWSVADPAKPIRVATIETAAMPSTVVFSPTSPLLGIGLNSGAVQVWDLRTPSEPALIHEFGDPHSSMYSLAFRADEELLIGTSGDDRIWGWDLTSDSATALFSLDGDLGRPWDARFVENGERFAVSGGTGEVKVWIADAVAAAAAVCSGRGSAVSAGEWERYLPGIEPRDPC